MAKQNISTPVLPTAYTEALSYGEALGKVITKVNECVDEVNQNDKKVDDLTNLVGTFDNRITENTNELGNKVDKITGKGLSTNDFTNVDKAKVEAIPADPKYTDTTYTAGEGIYIDDTNVIYADITATGNNIFTGTNTFDKGITVNGDSAFNTSTYFNDYVKFSSTVRVPEPTADTDAANKAYVESFVNTKVAENVVQETGQSTTAVMSQKATTDEINALTSDLATMDYWKKQRQRFSDKPIMIAYSQDDFGDWINSELGYVNNAIAGFRWIKGDVQPTSDGKLIMCHDDGFTLNNDGYIGAYNATSENTRVIHNMTYEECMALKYAQEFHIRTDYSSGTPTKIMYRPGVCDLEKFLLVCKEYEVRPYIVIRSNYMNVVVPELLRLLEAYDFLDNCIVNSFDINSITEVARQSNHRVMISWVKSYVQGTALTIEEVNNLLSVSPNCTINIFTTSTTSEWNNMVLADASKDAISYAKSLGVVVGTSFVEVPHLLFKRGIGLMQCQTLCVPTKVTPINLCVFLKNGVATMSRYGGYGAEYTANIKIETAKSITLYNIRKLGSTRDFSDGITPTLSIKMPYSLTVKGDNITGATLNWNDTIIINFDTKIADLNTSSGKRIFVKFVYGISN